MFCVILTVIRSLRGALAPRRDLWLENLALRHQLVGLNRRLEKPRFRQADRLLWVALPSVWSVEFFTIPAVPFRVLFVFGILAHVRRRIRHFAITEAPSTDWTAQQVVEAFAFAPTSK